MWDAPSSQVNEIIILKIHIQNEVIKGEAAQYDSGKETGLDFDRARYIGQKMRGKGNRLGLESKGIY